MVKNKMKMKTKNREQRTILALLSVCMVVLMTAGVFAQSVSLNGDKVIVLSDVGVGAPDMPVSSGGGSSGGGSRMSTLVQVEISPSKQATDDGFATYKVIVTDNHGDCVEPTDGREIACITLAEEYEYYLKFSGEEGITGDFEKDSFKLFRGQSESSELKVRTNSKGASNFIVYVGGDAFASAKGAIIFLDNVQPPISTSFFIGQGFIISDDESQGKFVDVKILYDDGKLSGKVRIGRENFKVEGETLYTTSGDTGVEFDLISLRSGEVAGSFQGYVKQFKDIKFLKGNLDNFEGDNWELSAVSRKNAHISEIEPGNDGELPVAIDDVIVVDIGEEPKEEILEEDVSTDVISETDSSADVYIRPVKIQKQKIFGFIPNPWGKKVVDVEVITGDKIVKKSITENSGKTFEGYKVSVGSLEDKESIEFSVEKA